MKRIVTKSSGIAWAGSPFLLALLLLSAGVFLFVFHPVPRPASPDRDSDTEALGLQAALAPDAISQRMDEILAHGNRLTGRPGNRAVAEQIAATAAQAGLEVERLPFRSLTPWSHRREVVSTEGEASVEIFPFLPNHFQPANTGREGIAGELVLVDDESVLERENFEGAIGLVDAANLPSGMGEEWLRYAQLGLRGVILAHRDGLEAIDWRPFLNSRPMTSPLPINYPRAVAGPEIFELVGRNVRLHLETTYENVDAETIVALLRAPRPAAEAIVVTVGFDAWSILPDSAPGVPQAVQLATALGLMEGMALQKDSLVRDVIFVFSGARMMAEQGDTTLLSAIGPSLDREAARAEWEARERKNDREAANVAEILQLMETPGFFENADATLQALANQASSVQETFQNQLTYVLNTVVYETSETAMQLGMDWDEREGTPEAERFAEARREANLTMAAAGLRPASLLHNRRAFLEEYHIREKLLSRLKELRSYHERMEREIRMALRVNEMFRDYRSVSVLSPQFLPGSGLEQVGIIMGDSFNPEGEITRRQGPLFSRLAFSILQEMTPGSSPDLVPTTAEPPHRMLAQVGRPPFSTAFWNRFAYPAFTLVNFGRLESYSRLPLPIVNPEMLELASLEKSLLFFGDLAMGMAKGEGRFRPPLNVTPSRYSGSVLVSGVGRSLTPNYPLKDAVVGSELNEQGWNTTPGRFGYLLIPTDPYGVYETGSTPAHWSFNVGERYSPQVVGYGRDGQITLIKDEGSLSQAIFRSIGLSVLRRNQTGVNVIVFRADPFPLVDLLNPQSMRPYTNAVFYTREGLAAVQRFNRFSTGQAQVTFLEPDQQVYVTLRAGSPDNELVQSVRGFLLGPPDPSGEERLGGISGLGYLPGRLDGPFSRTAWDLADSMLRLNSLRIIQQIEKNLVDARTVEFNERAADFLEESHSTDTQRQSLLEARDSATYSTMVHPVLLDNIFDAVVSIVWYLGLLVPFVFFFERLVFSFADIRKQLTAQAVIFLAVYLLLQLLHPAFGMIRSSVMILLGFVILLISGGITVLFAGKFRENLDELKQKRAQVTAAEADQMGIIATAFLLGLNNMHRRKVRTGLTCATLVLITFAMIAFTSIQSDIVDTEVAIGPADYQGFLVKNEGLAPIGEAEIFGLRTKYGTTHTVSVRSMFVGTADTHQPTNPELEIVYESPGGTRSMRFGSILRFSHEEPLRHSMGIEGNVWFPPARELQSDEPPPIFIPSSMANALGMEDPKVAGPQPVQINGGRFLVLGIFDPDVFNDLRDLDGNSLLPFDALGILNLRRDSQRNILAGPDEPRIPAAAVVLASEAPLAISVPGGRSRAVSVALSLGDLGYREARDIILTRLEQTGDQTYFGLDGVRYSGSRMRQASLEGLLDLLIPLVIAGLTVLNTMKGSVYERRDEIFVYNAVGIAPRFIFFMFIAEAFVYAVIGAVLGYILAQGTGSILTALDLTGGLNMTFAGLNSIYASLAVIAAVFLSTYFPARSAMDIAAPAEESGWDLPEPEGDILAFNLPFTFDSHDRIAVLAFFHRYLADHGEGGSGRFSAGAPEFSVLHADDGSPVPELHAPIWLKPFDLGVSQRLRISLPLDPETNEFIAHLSIERTSGTREAWKRLNRSFMVLLRKQFLHWRAVSRPQKAEFFREASQELFRNAGLPAPGEKENANV